MINDLPSNTEAFDELNVSCLDPVLKDYVFSSFFLARLVEKTMREKNELEKENLKLKAQLEGYTSLKDKFEELTAYVENLGIIARDAAAKVEATHVEDTSALANDPEFKDECFIKRNRDNLAKASDGEMPGEVAESVIDVVPEPVAEPVMEAIPEPVIDIVPEVIAEPVVEAVAEPAPEPEPAPAAAPAVEMPADANAMLTPEQIAALFAGV